MPAKRSTKQHEKRFGVSSWIDLAGVKENTKPKQCNYRGAVILYFSQRMLYARRGLIRAMDNHNTDLKISVKCSVNGGPQTLRSYPMERLLDVLREQLRLTGTKEGCGEGECGACSVVIDGQIVNSCLVPISQVEGSSIQTIEGIASDDQLHTVQQAFIECGGAQCGICTPGMVLAAVNLLEKNSHPSEAEIRNGVAGNLCRCTGYMKIFESVVRACEQEK